MARRYPATLLVLGLLLTVSAPASASTVLVLGFREGGKLNARVRQSVISFLARMGEEVVEPALPVAEQHCTQTECLVRLGERYQARRLVGGELIANDASYRINVWLFDRVSELPNSAEAVCTDCSAQMLADTVARTVGRALELEPDGRGNIVPPPQLPGTGAAAQFSTGCAAPYRSFGRGVALGSLTALTAAGLITGLTLYAHNRSELPLTSAYQLTFSLTAVAAAGIGAAAVPWQQIYGRQGSDSCATTALPGRRRSFERGLAAGALGTFAVLGLVSAFTLVGLNGHVYATAADGTPQIYALKPHYTAAFTISTAMIAGLGLTLFLP